MEELRKHANQMYEMVYNVLDIKGWRYAKNEEKRQVIFVTGDEEVTVSVGIGVDEQKQRIYLQSPFDVKVCEEKRMDFAVAVCEVNTCLADGCLEYDMANGTLEFRVSASFWNSEAGEGIVDYLIGSAYAVTARFGVMFDKLNQGQMSINEFLAMN